ncbi:MAG: helix-turn-helix domain-containing protein [Ancalomicrobiaceae bacterium]|nr:helix-turn-helix domain-containing protein [Ancalomicrobiaceae bacterium]
MPKDVADTPDREPDEAGSDLDQNKAVLLLGGFRSGGYAVRAHAHPRGQLAWPTSGVLRIVSGASVFIVPPSHAVWIPAGAVHQMVTDTDAAVRHLLIHPDRGIRHRRAHADRCSVVLMTPLLRELILRLEALEQAGADAERLRRFEEVVLDELDDLPESPLELPGGRDPRLVRLTRHLGGEPEERRPLKSLAAMVGSTTRTLERLFRAETGLTYRQWRARHRLLSSIERLNAGESTTAVALSLGYGSASAFAAAFKRHFGKRPQQY